MAERRAQGGENKTQGEAEEQASKAAARWWVDSDKRRHAPVVRPDSSVGKRFFHTVEGYEQERAHANLTDTNLKLLALADPPESGWGYVHLSGKACAKKKLQRLRDRVNLPAYARAAIVDCDGLVRILVTGTAVGEQVIEVTLGEAPSFDCWVDGEWICEELFDSVDDALGLLRGAIREFISPQGVDAWRKKRLGT